MATKSNEDVEEQEEEEQEQEGRGRAARKRIVRTFDVMALELLELSDQRCKNMPVTDVMKEALHDARTTTSKSARRRHIRHLASLLRDRPSETEAMKSFIAGEPYVAVSGDESYRHLDAAREALCDPETYSKAFDTLGKELPYIDLLLVKKLAETLHQGSNSKAYRALYKELRRASDESEEDADI